MCSHLSSFHDDARGSYRGGSSSTALLLHNKTVVCDPTGFPSHELKHALIFSLEYGSHLIMIRKTNA
jgi:hypothetical protein